MRLENGSPEAADANVDRPSTPLAFAQILRLPNVFTVPPDVLLGFWVASDLAYSPKLFFSLTASVLLYWSGMVLNDVFDFEVDQRERPRRPIPSGAISQRTARSLGIALLAAGVTAGALAGTLAMWIANSLAASILLYNAVLKSTLVAPAVMGACRMLNVLLGVAAASDDPSALMASGGLFLALSNGIYITGITVIARQEVAGTSLASLRIGAVLVLAGVLGHISNWFAADAVHWVAAGIMSAFVLIFTTKLTGAWRNPSPPRMMECVKTGILGLVAIDAASIAALHDPLSGSAVLVLLIPALWLGRWIYST